MFFESFDSYKNKAIYNLKNIVKIAEKKEKGCCYFFMVSGDFFQIKISLDELLSLLQKINYFKENFIECIDDYKSKVYYNKENICLVVEKSKNKSLIFAKDNKKHFVHTDYKEIIEKINK